jgi:hypothetical protein
MQYYKHPHFTDEGTEAKRVGNLTKVMKPQGSLKQEFNQASLTTQMLVPFSVPIPLRDL